MAEDGRILRDEDLTARMEPFDSFWEAPENLEKGYAHFRKFYSYNYLQHMPSDKDSRILVISCGPGYMVELLGEQGYKHVEGIDSFEEKVEFAQRRGLNCRVARVLSHLRGISEPLDVIFAEQEVNHLTKEEILVFLAECRTRLRVGGTLIVHSINGANPLTGSEARAGNFDHYNSLTEYSLRQSLEFAGYREVGVIPLHLYVFFGNPLNYFAWAIDAIKSAYYRLSFRLVGKSASIFTKKIAAVARK